MVIHMTCYFCITAVICFTFSIIPSAVCPWGRSQSFVGCLTHICTLKLLCLSSSMYCIFYSHVGMYMCTHTHTCFMHMHMFMMMLVTHTDVSTCATCCHIHTRTAVSFFPLSELCTTDIYCSFGTVKMQPWCVHAA